MKQLVKKIRSRHGASLAEMLFCVILVSFVFLLAVNGILFAYQRTYVFLHESYEQEIADTVLNKITSILMEAEGTESTAIKIAANKESIELQNMGVPVTIYLSQKEVQSAGEMEKANSGYLVVHYEQKGKSPNSNWAFHRKLYRDYAISHLKFDKVETGDEAVIKIDLGIRLIKNGNFFGDEYNSVTYANCYMVKDTQVVVLTERAFSGN